MLPHLEIILQNAYSFVLRLFVLSPFSLVQENKKTDEEAFAGFVFNWFADKCPKVDFDQQQLWHHSH